MSRITDYIIDREEKGDIQYNPDKAVYEELRQILQGKNNKPITDEHEQAVRSVHERLVK